MGTPAGKAGPAGGRAGTLTIACSETTGAWVCRILSALSLRGPVGTHSVALLTQPAECVVASRLPAPRQALRPGPHLRSWDPAAREGGGCPGPLTGLLGSTTSHVPCTNHRGSSIPSALLPRLASEGCVTSSRKGGTVRLLRALGPAASGGPCVLALLGRGWARRGRPPPHCGRLQPEWKGPGHRVSSAFPVTSQSQGGRGNCLFLQKSCPLEEQEEAALLCQCSPPGTLGAGHPAPLPGGRSHPCSRISVQCYHVDSVGSHGA